MKTPKALPFPPQREKVPSLPRVKALRAREKDRGRYRTEFYVTPAERSMLKQTLRAMRNAKVSS